MAWTAIWTPSQSVVRPVQQAISGAPTFLLEGRWPARADQPLWRAADGGFDACATPSGGLSLRHGKDKIDLHQTDIRPGERFRFTVRSGPASHLELRNLDSGGCAAIAGQPVMLGAAAIQPSPEMPDNLAGVAAYANDDAPLGDGMGLAAGTPVATRRGLVTIDALVPGDIVRTETGGFAAVRSVERREAITVGSMAAVRLRAPYFGLSKDVRVSRATRVLLSGAEIDYTFGCPEVLAEAGDLINGVSVLRDHSTPISDLVCVDLDRPGCLAVGRARFASSEAATDAPVIDRAGAQAVLSMTRDGRGPIG